MREKRFFSKVLPHNGSRDFEKLESTLIKGALIFMYEVYSGDKTEKVIKKNILGA